MTDLKQNNRLILDFMGIKPRMISPDNYSWADSPYFHCNHDTPEKVMESILEYAKYSTDWNWLMKCVEKVESLGLEYTVEIRQNECIIYTENMVEYIAESGETKIIGTYQAVNQFINWYNQNKQA